MNDTDLPSTPAHAEPARSIAGALGASEAQLASLAFEMLDRTGVLWSIKEVASGRYVHVNTAMADLFARSVAEVIDHSDADLMQPAQAAAIRTAEQAALGQSLPTLSDQRIERDGERREFRVTRFAVPRADGGNPRHVLSAWVDVTADNRRETQLQLALTQLEQQQIAAEALRRETQDQALRDGVTGLYQQVHFEDQLRREVDLSSREHREFALVAISLDPATDAVKALGEEARTRIFEALGRLLRSNTRAMDASCRLDQDRFAILLSGVGLATAHSRMEGLRRQCATQIVVLDGRDIGFTVSMGVASFPHTAHTEGELMNAAELALIEAQKRGGNHVTLASIRFEMGA